MGDGGREKKQRWQNKFQLGGDGQAGQAKSLREEREEDIATTHCILDSAWL